MTVELARRLLAAGAVHPRDIEAALYLSVVRGVSLARGLVDRGVLSERALEEELSRRAGLALRHVGAAPELVRRLPRGMCRMLAAIPLRVDPSNGVVDVAAVDPLDPHIATEFAFHLGTEVRVQRATMGAIEEAIRHLELAAGTPPSRARRRTPAFPHGAPDTVPPSPPPPASHENDEPIPLVRKVGAPPLPSFVPAYPPGATDDEDESSELRAPPSRRSVMQELPVGPSVSFPSMPPRGDRPDSEQIVRIAAPSHNELESIARGPAYDSQPPSEGHILRAPGPLAQAAALDTGWDETSPPRLASLQDIATALDANRSTGSVGGEANPPSSDAPTQEPTTLQRARTDEVERGPRTIQAPPPSAALRRDPSKPFVRAPDAGWSPTLPELYDLIARAGSRDELLDLVLRALTLVASRVAIFVVKGGAYAGWACNPAFGSEEDLKGVRIPIDHPSILATATVAGYYLGPIPQTQGHLALFTVVGDASSDVAVYIAKVKGRPVLALVADELDDLMHGTRAMGELADRSGQAISRMLTGRMSGM